MDGGAGRIEQIMNIDTASLLRTLKELETRLSDQYRQDVSSSVDL